MVDSSPVQPTAVVIGESLVDVVLDASGGSFEGPGGPPLNVAVALSRLGVRTSLVTALGQ
jgi:fructokinase